MSEKQVDKKTESINALKNANKHLADLFGDLSKKDLVLSLTANDLSYIARQCGDILVHVYQGQSRTAVSLKLYLEGLAIKLNEAR